MKRTRTCQVRAYWPGDLTELSEAGRRIEMRLGLEDGEVAVLYRHEAVRVAERVGLLEGRRTVDDYVVLPDWLGCALEALTHRAMQTRAPLEALLQDLASEGHADTRAALLVAYTYGSWEGALAFLAEHWPGQVNAEVVGRSRRKQAS